MVEAAPRVADAAVEVLHDRAAEWATLPVVDRLRLVEALIERFVRVAPDWAAAASELEGLTPDRPEAGEEWLTGPALALRYLRHVSRSLLETAEHGHPRIPGSTTRRPNGQLSVPVFPRDWWDRLFFPGVTGRAWLEPGAAVTHAGPGVSAGRVCLVLGGGNVSAIPVLDALGKLFVDGEVVLLKLHRLTPFLEPVLAEALEPLIQAGFVRVVAGGGTAGRELARHPDVDELHVTGSHRTYEAIVFGDGADGVARKARGEPTLDKPITAELGNVTPVIVIPGRWSRRDFAVQGENIASMLTNNAGFNCAAARVVITPRGWSGRDALLDAVRSVLAATPTRRAWYPGAAERFSAIVDGHPLAERYGESGGGRLPWAFITGLDADRLEEPSFRSEAFCSVFAEARIAASSVEDYIDRAVRFANDGLWGTLAANLIVHPGSVRQRKVTAAVQRAIADLRFGTVAVNYWSAFGFGNGVSPWGAFPGSSSQDIQSGAGFTHNALMLQHVQKSVIQGPFRPWPKPPYFASHRTLHLVGQDLVQFEARPAIPAAVRLGWSAVRG